MSVASISRHLTAAGLVTPTPAKRPKSSYIRFAAEQPNQRWQADFTHWWIAGRVHTEILTWLDDHSRYALSVTAHHRVTGTPSSGSRRRPRENHPHRDSHCRGQATNGRGLERINLPSTSRIQLLRKGISAQVDAAITLVDQLHALNALNADDAALLRLIARWAPYGVPPEEDVYVTCGLNGQQARRRVVDILTRCPRRSAACQLAVTLTRLLGTPNTTPALDDWRRRLDTATTTSRSTFVDPHS